MLIEEEVQANKNQSSNKNNSFKKINNSPSSSKSNDINAITAEKGGYRKPKKVFTPLGMTIEEAFTRLYVKRAIQPIGPTPDPAPENRSSKWNSNAYYKYQQENGNPTSSCWALRNTLQDMVDSDFWSCRQWKPATTTHKLILIKP